MMQFLGTEVDVHYYDKIHTLLLQYIHEGKYEEVLLVLSLPQICESALFWQTCTYKAGIVAILLHGLIKKDRNNVHVSCNLRKPVNSNASGININDVYILLRYCLPSCQSSFVYNNKTNINENILPHCYSGQQDKDVLLESLLSEMENDNSNAHIDLSVIYAVLRERCYKLQYINPFSYDGKEARTMMPIRNRNDNCNPITLMESRHDKDTTENNGHTVEEIILAASQLAHGTVNHTHEQYNINNNELESNNNNNGVQNVDNKANSENAESNATTNDDEEEQQQEKEKLISVDVDNDKKSVSESKKERVTCTLVDHDANKSQPHTKENNNNGDVDAITLLHQIAPVSNSLHIASSFDEIADNNTSDSAWTNNNVNPVLVNVNATNSVNAKDSKENNPCNNDNSKTEKEKCEDLMTIINAFDVFNEGEDDTRGNARLASKVSSLATPSLESDTAPFRSKVNYHNKQQQEQQQQYQEQLQDAANSHSEFDEKGRHRIKSNGNIINSHTNGNYSQYEQSEEEEQYEEYKKEKQYETHKTHNGKCDRRYNNNSSNNKRRRTHYTDAEDVAIIHGVARYGQMPRNFPIIYESYKEVWLPGRTPMKLYDHWRDSLRRSAINDEKNYQYDE